MEKGRIDVGEDLPGLGEAIKKIFPKSDGQLCVLHAVWDSLHQVGLKQRRLFETSGQPGGRSGSRKLLRAAWLSLHHQPAGEARQGGKRRTEGVEVFVGEGAVEKLLYLVHSALNEG